MREPGSEQFQKPREDVVLSACFSDLKPDEPTFRAIRELAQELDAVYRFCEIILVVEDTDRDAFLSLVKEVRDLRLFVVRRGTDYYERRVIAAEEAIGDIVLIANIEEVVHMNVLDFLDHAEQSGAITLANQQARRPLKRLLASPFVMLGRLAGFKVDPSDFQTIAMPRTMLNHLLGHDDPRLALRFPPRDPRLPSVTFGAVSNVASRGAFKNGAFGHLSRRAQLLQAMLVYLAPTILSIVAFSSSLLTLLGFAYAAYIVGAVIVVDTLAPGWLTTSTMLSVSAVFMGVSTLGLSLALQHLLKQHAKDRLERVSEEVNRIDLFGKVAQDLNVELDREPPTATLPAKDD